MRRLISVLLLFFLLPVWALADYELTPAKVSEKAVMQKLEDLGYLAADPRKNAASSLITALENFEKDQEIEEDETPHARTLVRLFALTDLSGLPATVWVPVYGGKKYHREENTCAMDSPENVSLSVASELGYTACKKCYR